MIAADCFGGLMVDLVVDVEFTHVQQKVNRAFFLKHRLTKQVFVDDELRRKR